MTLSFAPKRSSDRTVQYIMNITAYEYDTILPSCVQLLSLTLAHRLRVTELSILEDKNRIHVLPHEDSILVYFWYTSELDYQMNLGTASL